MSKLRCTWCCKDVESGPPCPMCGNHSVSDKTAPHRAEWSRKTIRSMECKVCDREISNEDYFRGSFEPYCNNRRIEHEETQ